MNNDDTDLEFALMEGNKNFLCPSCGVDAEDCMCHPPKEPQPSQGAGAEEEEYRAKIRPDGITRACEDSAYALGIECYGHPINPMTGKGRPTARFGDYLAGYAAGRASQDARIGEMHKESDALRERIVLVEDSRDFYKRAEKERLDDAEAAEKERDSLRSSLALAKEALEKWRLADDVLEMYRNEPDDASYCGWQLGRYRAVVAALAAMGKVGGPQEGEK